MSKLPCFQDGEAIIRHSPENGTGPSIARICTVIGWAFDYAPADAPLNESHPLWGEFFPRSEWFREQIAQILSLPADTKWEEIYRLSGVLNDTEYKDMKECYAAWDFGENTRLDHPEVAQRLEELELIKYRIVGRI